MKNFVAYSLILFSSACASPMDFACGSLLKDNKEPYETTHLFGEIQRDASDDFPQSNLAKRKQHRAESKSEPGQDVLEIIDEGDPFYAVLKGLHDRKTDEAINILMLSGGGAWGAFGAGFLSAYPQDWQVVTGVSTGAIQSLFVAANDVGAMSQQYRIKNENEIATEIGLIGLIRNGSQYDINPLRKRLKTYLLSKKDGISILEHIGSDAAPALFIAAVEAKSGDLIVFHVTEIVRKGLSRTDANDQMNEGRIAECITGIAMASSSIPVRLTPVRVDGKTYVDGGVRSSVFDSGIGRRANAFKNDVDDPTLKLELFIVRNGPTLVPPEATSRAKKNGSPVDRNPNVFNVGLRGYSTIVNQNELMSIAALRLNFPTGPIYVITADGYNSPRNSQNPCGERPRSIFDPAFMSCLNVWGSKRATDIITENDDKWIALSEIIFETLAASETGNK